ncbi:LuxR C-terminal-related transcriptional regulator [Streptomyces sp. NPDC050636]|uniref:helix-turn-helix transcriptional regulator n=1 Tax=Streptomyces sp. NPDC050636 TaxID=3154510 RepID=UPI003440BEAE
MSCRGPLLLAVDDAHLADAPSMRFLAYAARRLASMPVLLVICTATGQPALDEASRHDLAVSAHRIELTGLPPADATRLLQQSASAPIDEDFAAACHQATGGNPLLLQALLCTLKGPDGRLPTEIRVKDVLELSSPKLADHLRRKLHASPEAERIAQAVAILGDNAEFRQVSALVATDLRSTAHALDTLVRLKILRNTYPLAFTHSLVRNTVLEDMSVGARITAHGEAARLLHEAHAPDDQVAAHLLKAGAATPWAVDTLRRAAGRAMGRGAPDVSATYLRHALTQPLVADQRAKVLCELGNAELAFDSAAGIARLRTALDETTDPRDAANAALNLIPRLAADSTHEAIATADRVAKRLPAEERDLGWHLRCMAFIAAYTDLATAAEARVRRDELCADVPDSPQLRRARLTFLAVREALEGGSREDAVRYARDAIAKADLTVFERPYLYALSVLIRADELDQVEQLCRGVEQEARASGYLRPTAIVLLARGLTASFAGRYAEAAELLQSSLDLFDEWDTSHSDPDAPGCAAALVEVLTIRGRFDEAWQVLSRRDLLGDVPTLLPYSFVLIARGNLRVRTGDVEAGLHDLLECGRRVTAWKVTNPAVFPWRSAAAQAYLALGQHDRARTLAESELESARRWGTERAIGTALRVSAMARDDSEAHGLLTEALATLRNSPAKHQLALTLLDLAALNRRSREPEAARSHLLEATALVRECDAEPLATRLHQELITAGVDHPTATGVGGRLTDQEGRIAALATKGLTNRQIASALYVTLRTVEFHLTSVYRKFGIDGRPQLAEAMGQYGHRSQP